MYFFEKKNCLRHETGLDMNCLDAYLSYLGGQSSEVSFFQAIDFAISARLSNEK